MRRLALVSLIALGLAACQQQAAPPAQTGTPAPAASAASASAAVTPPHAFAADITAGDFAAHLERLSSDEFEGRKPGTIGERLTTDYIVEQFKRIGLQPGNHGDWFQSVPVVSTDLQNRDVTLDVAVGGGTEKFAYKTDMVVNTLQAQPDVKLDGSDIVFVGYGVDAPEYRWNDYAGVDVKGKTVIVLINDPGWDRNDPGLFKGRAMTYYGRWTYKYEEAARKGAAACFIVHETEPAAYGWNVVENSWDGPQLDLPASEDPAPRLPVAGWLTHEAAQRLFAKAGLDFEKLKAAADQRGFKPVALNAKASIELHSKIENTRSANVLGLLKGSERPDEVVVYSAHWDHLGKDPSLQGDQIFNGAIDNATGVAAMLEIAEAFAHQNPKPKRSVLFVGLTLEESGLLGSKYYVAHPAFPLNKTVADINMDALPIIGPEKDMEVVGYGQSELEDYLKAALAAEGRSMTPEASPEKGHYFRSDHFNFAKAGVPALDASGGIDLVNGGEEAGRKAMADYVEHRYHSPADAFDPNWDYRGVIEDVQTLYAVGEKLAGESSFPQWRADSEFRAAREKSMQQK
ncbi:peptidase M28 [Mizugakiibacter sediminis]|uniref:Aminopeptidase n=1 Tax=Mizugakiibacter sediminis TaxID=1475481 RepID=A0A0K8QJ61_9GAMM|nr:M28 family metallopeptidase [Mizugakiibacter sediminis]GAP64864.1 peptidase M28 [Mizugakiibacter sediminis]